MTRRAADDRLFLTECEIALVGIAALIGGGSACSKNPPAAAGPLFGRVDIGRLSSLSDDAPGWRLAR